MIYLESNEIGPHPSKMEVIKEWVVWYQTPFGLHSERSLAIEHCRKADLDPELMIQPVAVAIGMSCYYERR